MVQFGGEPIEKIDTNCLPFLLFNKARNCRNNFVSRWMTNRNEGRNQRWTRIKQCQRALCANWSGSIIESIADMTTARLNSGHLRNAMTFTQAEWIVAGTELMLINTKWATQSILTTQAKSSDCVKYGRRFEPEYNLSISKLSCSIWTFTHHIQYSRTILLICSRWALWGSIQMTKQKLLPFRNLS